MSEKDKQKALAELEKMFSEGDAWLRTNGIVTPIMHNNIVLVLRAQFPKIKNLEYFMDIDERKIDVTLYVSFWNTFFMSKNKLLEDVFDVLSQYLVDYDIKIKVKRYKKRKRESNV